MSDKKPRCDSKLDTMKPESRVLELRDMMLAGTGHREILEWLALECGVTCSPSALTTFYKRHCWPVIRERRQVSVIKAEALGDAMAKDPINWDDKIIEKTKQLAFEFLAADPNDSESIGKLLDSIIKAKKQDFTEKIQTAKHELEQRRVDLMEKKAAQADKAKDVTGNEALTAEEKQARLKQIFGMG
jgi:hypothetical protein